MVSNELAKYLEPLLFPVKLYELAWSDEVKSIYWSRDGTAVKLDTARLGKECFRVEIFKVKDHKHVFRQLSYYGFCRIQRTGQIWEFYHPYFRADDIDKVKTIKRKGKKHKNVITAADIKPYIANISTLQTRKSSRLQNKVKEGAYSSFFEIPELKEEPISEDLIPTEIKKKFPSKRGRKKRSSSSIETPIVKEEVKKRGRGRRKRDSPFFEVPVLKTEPIPQSSATPRASRTRRKHDRSSSFETSVLREDRLPESLAVPEAKRPRACRTRRKCDRSSSFEIPVLVEDSLPESLIGFQAKVKPQGSRSCRKRAGRKKGSKNSNPTTQTADSLLKASSKQSTTSGKDLNLLKISLKSDFEYIPDTKKCSSLKEEIDFQMAEETKPRRGIGRRKRRGGRGRKKSPSYHATFKPDFKTCDFSGVSYNCNEFKLSQMRACNSSETRYNAPNNVQSINSTSNNSDLKPSFFSNYNNISNFKDMCRDFSNLNVCNFEENPEPSRSPVTCVRRENNILQDKGIYHSGSQNLHGAEEIDISTEIADSLENPEIHRRKLKFTKTDKICFQDSSFSQHHENMQELEDVIILNEVSNRLKDSQIYQATMQPVKIENDSEHSNNLPNSKTPYHLENVSEESKTHFNNQTLIDSIKNEHNYYCAVDIAEDSSNSFINMNSYGSHANRSSSNDFLSIKIKEENPNIFLSNVSGHFVLDSVYKWKPINKNSARIVQESNLTHSDRNVPCSLGNIANQSTVSHDIENYSKNTSNSTVYQSEPMHLSLNRNNVFQGSDVTHTAIHKQWQKQSVKFELQNVTSTNSTNSCVNEVHLCPAEHSGISLVNSSNSQISESEQGCNDNGNNPCTVESGSKYASSHPANLFVSQAKVPDIINLSLHEAEIEPSQNAKCTNTHQVFCQAYSSSNVIDKATAAYLSYCQTQNPSVQSKISETPVNTVKKKKSSKPKKLAAKSRKKKIQKSSSNETASVKNNAQSSFQCNPNQEIQGTKNSVPGLFEESGTSSNQKDYFLPLAQNDLDHLLSETQQFDIELIDLTNLSPVKDSFSSEIEDNVRENDHSKIYVKEEMEDYTLSDDLRQQLVYFLHKQYVSGKLSLDELMFSENPYIRYYSLDAIMFDIYH